MNILALAPCGPRAAAALLSRGEVVALAEAPAGGPGFPRRLVEEVLGTGQVHPAAVDRLVLAGEPEAPQPPVLLGEQAPRPAWGSVRLLRRHLARLDRTLAARPLRRWSPLAALAGGAYYASPHGRAAVLAFSGRDFGSRVSLAQAEGERLTLRAHLPPGHSPVRLLESFGRYLGLRPDRLAYEFAYLGAYGTPRYSRPMLERLVELRRDGSFRFTLLRRGLPDPAMPERLRRAGVLPPPPAGALNQDAADVARSVAAVVRYLLGHLAVHTVRRGGGEALVLAGAPALELARARLLPEEGALGGAWVGPLGDASAMALGAGVAAWQELGEGQHARPPMRLPDLGPLFTGMAVESFLQESAVPADTLPPDRIPGRAAELVRHHHRVGWFQGREESAAPHSGRRNRLHMVERQALGRLRDPRGAPAVPEPLTLCVLAEHVGDYFEPAPADMPASAPWLGPRLMYWKGARTAPAGEVGRMAQAPLRGRGPVRVLPVEPGRLPELYRMLVKLQEATGLPVVRAEPLADARGRPARTPQEAYALLHGGELDALVIAHSIVFRLDDLPAPEPGPRPGVLRRGGHRLRRAARVRAGRAGAWAARERVRLVSLLRLARRRLLDPPASHWQPAAGQPRQSVPVVFPARRSGHPLPDK